MLHIVDNIIILENELNSNITFGQFTSLDVEVTKDCCDTYDDTIDLVEDKEWRVLLPLTNAVIREVTFRNTITGKLYTLSGLNIILSNTNDLQITLTNAINVYLNKTEIDADGFATVNIAITSTTTANVDNHSYDLKNFIKHHIPYSVTYDVHIIGNIAPESVNNVSYFNYKNSQSNTYLNSENNLYIFPKLLNNSYFDNGIYTVSATLKNNDDTLVYKVTKCIFIDYNLKEKIIELDSKEVLLSYYGLNNSDDCDCDCDFKCEIYDVIKNSLLNSNNYINDCNCS